MKLGFYLIATIRNTHINKNAQFFIGEVIAFHDERTDLLYVKSSNKLLNMWTTNAPMDENIRIVHKNYVVREATPLEVALF
jgi:hypothetical protein